jgi:hypothetical protein
MYQNIPAAEFDFSQLVLPHRELMVLQRFFLSTQDSMSGLDAIIDTTVNDRAVYLLTQGPHITVQVQREDFKPILYRETDTTGALRRQIEYGGQQARILIPDQRIDKIIAIKQNTYDKATLFYLFRCLPFNRPGEKVSFSFIVITEKYSVRLVEMYVRVIGKQEVQIRAGRYSCYKVELGVAGLIGKLFVPQKWYYYFLQQPPYRFIKYEEPGREIIELVNIIISGN